MKIIAGKKYFTVRELRSIFGKIPVTAIFLLFKNERIRCISHNGINYVAEKEILKVLDFNDREDRIIREKILKERS